MVMRSKKILLSIRISLQKIEAILENGLAFTKIGRVKSRDTVPFVLLAAHQAPPNQTIPYHTIPHPTLPYQTIPYPSLPYPTIPYHTIPYPTLQYPTKPYHTLPYPTIPYPTIPNHTRTIWSENMLSPQSSCTVSVTKIQ